MKHFPRLFQRGRIGKLELRNRIIMAPMGTNLTEPDGRYSERQIDYFVARAKGGVGLILTEATMIEKKISPAPDLPIAYLDSPCQIPRASDLVEAVHSYGAKIGVQLSTGPGRNYVDVSPQKPPISASSIPTFMDPNVLCHALTIAEIKEIVKACGDAAHRALMAGFDLIELHAHAGYLIDQFMTRLWNKRSDEYGGDIEGRMRFAIELVNEIKARVGDGFPVCFRYAAEHRIEGGRTLAESQEIARRLEAAGLDILHIDAGAYESRAWIIPPTYLPDGCLVDLAAAVKQAVNIPVITVGSISTPGLAERILKEGKADFICLGRGLLADPDWPNKAQEGRVEDIRPCIRCLEGCIGRVYSGRSISCSVNPTVGNECRYAITRAKKPKKVLVIGGGPAGMEAARVAALRGHRVTLYEQEDKLGGQLRPASDPPFKSSVGNLGNYLSIQLDKLGVKIITGKKVTPHLVDLEKPEAVVMATGANPLIPSIPGIKNEKIIMVADLHLGKKKVGAEVVVAGGGLAGCEVALHLAQQGKKVTIVEMLPEVARDLNMRSRISLMEELRKSGVIILTDLTIKEFTSNGLLATNREGKQQNLKADTVILAMGARSENRLAENLREKVHELYIVGDCVKPRKIGEAIREGFIAGWRI